MIGNGIEKAIYLQDNLSHVTHLKFIQGLLRLTCDGIFGSSWNLFVMHLVHTKLCAMSLSNVGNRWSLFIMFKERKQTIKHGLNQSLYQQECESDGCISFMPEIVQQKKYLHTVLQLLLVFHSLSRLVPTPPPMASTYSE